jgi:hypothetical protein
MQGKGMQPMHDRGDVHLQAGLPVRHQALANMLLEKLSFNATDTVSVQLGSVMKMVFRDCSEKELCQKVEGVKKYFD